MTNSFLVWALVNDSGTALDPTKLVLQAHWVVQGVMIILLAASIAAWTVIFWKMVFLGAAAKENKKFHDAFWSAGSLDAAIRASKAHPSAGLTRIFESGLHEFNQINSLQLNRGDTLELIETNVSRALSKSVKTEVEGISKFNSLLANIASVAPFVGLFGTVWGIMTAFLDIEAKGSSSLAAVAPGIAEALIATAMGLFAAIPAVIAYNYFVARGKSFVSNMNAFSSDFINTAKRSL